MTSATWNPACPRLELQPTSPEDRRGLRQPRNHHRRQCAEVLRQRPPRHSQDWRRQERRAAPPFRECEFEITYGTGIFAVGEIVDLASEAGLIEKSGAYYSLDGERIAQGRHKACQYLGEHPGLVDDLREKLVALRKAENARLGARVPVASGESEAAA